jgi:hypothetical protein
MSEKTHIQYMFLHVLANNINNQRVRVTMWGFGIYLMRVADYLRGRKLRRKRLGGSKVCRVCGRIFDKEAELDVHTRDQHPNMV